LYDDHHACRSVIALARKPRFDIPESELEWRFDTSGGPGGQHANRSNTRVELRFDIGASSAFDEALRQRLIGKLGSEIRISEAGSRSQTTNRTRALRRLHATLGEAARPNPPGRLPTRPSISARRRRVDQKRRRARTKQFRKRPGVDE
jgi:ribosome-associated protein